MGLLVLIGSFASWLLSRKMKNNNSAIENIKGVQEELQKAQKSLEEESLSLDNKLIDIFERQVQSNNNSIKEDHSLVLKVANEIVRIEYNLSRMDSSIKGYKQLTKGVERIKNNFIAKGYEIAEMMGQPFNEGMRVKADFILDESLEQGSRIITKVIEPQVIFNGELLQKAYIVVSQNI